MKKLHFSAVVFSFCFASPALCEIRVCNEYIETVYVAVGWVEGGDTKTQGWWDVNTGKCRVIDGRPLQKTYYLYVETKKVSIDDGHSLRHVWGKNIQLVVGSDRFIHSDSQPLKSGDRVVGFKEIASNFSKYKDATYTIKKDGKETTTDYK